jgi:hypothetical protein
MFRKKSLLKGDPMMNRSIVASRMLIGLAAGVVLLSGAAAGGAASAALFGPAPTAGDSLALSGQNQSTVWSDLSKAPTSQPPSTFEPAASSAVPSTIRIRAIPPRIASDIPALRPYDYAKLPGKILIINPHDMMIAKVISG